MTVLRNLGAAVLGFVVMYVAVVVLMLVMALVVDGSGGLAVGSIVVSLVAAFLGGIVCAKVAADTRGVWILIGVVVVLGIGSVLMADTAVEMMTEVAEVDMTGAMDSAQEPGWLAWLTPLLGAVGVYFGARLVKGD